VNHRLLERTSSGSARRSTRLTALYFAGALLVLPLVLLLVLFVLVPIFGVLLDSLGDEDLALNYRRFFNSNASVLALIRTLRVALYVTLICTIIALIVAWYLRTLRSRAIRALIWAAVLIPFWMGIVIKNYSLIIIFGRRGPFNELLTSLGAIPEPLEILYTEHAVLIGMVYTMLPYAILPLYAMMTTIDLDLLRAAQSLGASRTRAIASVMLPLALPGAIASATIVFVISLGFFITPIILGGGKTPFVATVIQDHIFYRYDYGAAAATSAILLIAAIASIGAALLIVGRERIERAVA
jgi:mannopine transport system permease protein